MKHTIEVEKDPESLRLKITPVKPGKNDKPVEIRMPLEQADRLARIMSAASAHEVFTFTTEIEG